MDAAGNLPHAAWMAGLSVETVVALLELSPHPEGGFYREVFRAAERVARLDGTPRTASTAIYFLLPITAFSAWHEVRSDEAWHFYDGLPLELHTIDPAGTHRVALLGRELAAGERPQQVVPACWLQAARPIAGSHPDDPDYALCGCTVSPGFEFADFALPGRAALRARYPALVDIVDAFTHPEPA